MFNFRMRVMAATLALMAAAVALSACVAEPGPKYDLSQYHPGLHSWHDYHHPAVRNE